MKKFLTLLTILAGMQVSAAFANDWYCSTQSSRGFSYNWQSWDYNDAYRQSSDTCARYESGLGYCYATNCQQVGGYPPPPPRRGTVWHCDAQSNRGYTYSYEDATNDRAIRGAFRTCQQYESPYGGSCYTPRCYQR